ncbi:dCTP deaminase [Micromonospora sp. NIE79]|uniref:dCTP deaminase n=1 Tax=Micromonospora trifolii TaxID=2911208 RepID=A0ABS9N1N9_9ACTN|nr:dCTP deaminase [Micromonospora trifolii]MCG5443868.1 dCTP deaminase [Micromonospora trifolii]
MLNESFIGGWLSGTAIAAAIEDHEIYVSPFDPAAINPNSYNYRLGASISRLVSPEIDLRVEDEFEEMTIEPEGLVLLPGECYLGHTVEVFGSSVYASLVTGRSSIGRKFITNHVTAGLIDVGFCGQITLEITVQRPTRVYEGSHFGQIFWFSLLGNAQIQYQGKYQGQRGATPARLGPENLQPAISNPPLSRIQPAARAQMVSPAGLFNGP